MFESYDPVWILACLGGLIRALEAVYELLTTVYGRFNGGNKNEDDEDAASRNTAGKRK